MLRLARSPGWEWLALGEGKEPRGRKISNRFVEFVEAVRKVEAELKPALKKRGPIRRARTTPL